MGVLTVALIGCGVWLALAGLQARKKWATSPTRVWLAAPVVIASIGFASLLAVEVTHHSREAQLTAAIQEYAGHDEFAVSCQRLDKHVFQLGYYDGVAHPETGMADLSYGACAALSEYSSSAKVRDSPTLEHVDTLNTFTYMVEYLEGVWRAEVANCYAAQESHLVAQVLGASYEQARRQQSLNFREIYPQMHADYRSADCGPGRELDLYPERTEFP